MKRLYIDQDAPTGEITRTTALSPGLGADRTTLPSDGSAAATLHYAQEQPGDADWLVNGTPYSEALAQDVESGLWWSEIEVTASVPGPVEVAVNGSTLTLEAE